MMEFKNDQVGLIIVRLLSYLAGPRMGLSTLAFAFQYSLIFGGIVGVGVEALLIWVVLLSIEKTA